MSSPGLPTGHLGGGAGEETPLLGMAAERRKRGLWRAIWCGELDEGDERTSWSAGWVRFWNPVGRSVYWIGLVHLWLLNFPFVSPSSVVEHRISSTMPTSLIFSRRVADADATCTGTPRVAAPRCGDTGRHGAAHNPPDRRGGLVAYAVHLTLGGSSRGESARRRVVPQARSLLPPLVPGLNSPYSDSHLESHPLPPPPRPLPSATCQTTLIAPPPDHYAAPLPFPTRPIHPSADIPPHIPPPQSAVRAHQPDLAD